MISVVTETELDPGVRRITEKTIKPLALGHPLVIIGCQHAPDVARELGFSVFDDVIDHDYAGRADPNQRLLGAVESARDFMERYRREPAVRSAVQDQSRHNREWALEGFAQHYSGRFRAPLLEFLGL